MSYPSILDAPNPDAPPPNNGDAGGPAPPSGSRIAILAIGAVIVALTGIAAVRYFSSGPPDGVAPRSTTDPTPIPAPALIGTFGGTNISSGGREWVTIGIDRVAEARGVTRFRYRLLRGGNMNGEDGEGIYEPKTGQIQFGAGGTSFAGRLAREDTGQIVLMASDPARGFSVRLHHP